MTKNEKVEALNNLVVEFRTQQHKSLELFNLAMEEASKIDGFDSKDPSVACKAMGKAEHYEESHKEYMIECDMLAAMKNFCKTNRCMYLFKGWE